MVVLTERDATYRQARKTTTDNYVVIRFSGNEIRVRDDHFGVHKGSEGRQEEGENFERREHHRTCTEDVHEETSDY